MILSTQLLAGCAMRGNVDVLESKLRTQESLISRYERDLTELRGELNTSQRELDLMRNQVAQAGHEIASEEVSRHLARVDGIVFHTFLTAGQNRDDIPGDERLHAMLYPHDSHGEVVKIGGQLEVEAIDLARSGNDRTIGHWTFSSEETRDLWHAGFLSSGYQLDLPWERNPLGSKVLLVARLETADGRKFEATHTMSVIPGSEQPASAPQQLPKAEESRPIQQATHSFSRHPIESDDSLLEWESADEPSDSVESSDAKPFPTKTSDNWTEDTIPLWR